MTFFLFDCISNSAYNEENDSTSTSPCMDSHPSALIYADTRTISEWVLVVYLNIFYCCILFIIYLSLLLCSYVNQSPVPPVRSTHSYVYPTLDTSNTTTANPFDEDDDDNDTSLEKSTNNR